MRCVGNEMGGTVPSRPELKHALKIVERHDASDVWIEVGEKTVQGESILVGGRGRERGWGWRQGRGVRQRVGAREEGAVSTLLLLLLQPKMKRGIN